MKLDNRTKYDTRTLRKLLIAVFRAQSGVFQARIPQWKRLQVHVSYARPGSAHRAWLAGHYTGLGMLEDAERIANENAARRLRHVSGCAYVGGVWAELRLPSREVGTAHLAAVWVHELWHIAGSNHDGFPPSVMRCHTESYQCVADAFGATLTEAAPKPKPVVDLTAVRRLRIEERLSGWESRLKRAQKAVSKLKRQVSYYDRREKLAAAKAGG